MMSKNKETLIKSTIFLITILLLTAARLLFNYIGNYFSDNILNWLFSFTFQVLCLGVIPFVLYTKLLKKSPREMLSNFKIRKPSGTMVGFGILIGFLLFFATMGVSSIWSQIIKALGYQAGEGVGSIFSGGEVLILDIIMSAMLPGFFEEFIDRGLLLDTFSGKKNKNFVIFVIALAFGAAHQNIGQFGYAMFGGLIFAYMAIKCDSLIPGMIAHFMNNGLATLISFGMQKQNIIGEVYYKIMNVLGSEFFFPIAWIGSIVGIFAIIKILERNKGKARSPQPSQAEISKNMQLLKENVVNYILRKFPNINSDAVRNMDIVEFLAANACNADYVQFSNIDVDYNALITYFYSICDKMEEQKRIFYIKFLMIMSTNNEQSPPKAVSNWCYLPIYIGMGIALVTTFLPFIVSII